MKQKMISGKTALIISAAVYFILDIATRFNQFMGLSDFAGPKNFLPLTLGLLMGPWSAPGMCAGELISALAVGTPLPDAAAEAISIVIMTVGGWYLWYAGNRRPVYLKRKEDYIRFLLIAAVLSALCSVSAIPIMGMRAWREMAVCYFIFSVFIGVPVIILATSIFCIRSAGPKGYCAAPDVEAVIGPDANGLDELQEKIEELYLGRGFTMKHVFPVENCLEETIVRLQGGCDNGPVEISLFVMDSTSLFVSCSGRKFNPLLRQPGETEEDLLGLVMIKQRALRASYSYRGSCNYLHIVI